MKVHDLRPPAGSTRARRRVGRGIAGKGGKTAGRGTKGQGARDTIPPGFEGGQLPADAAHPQAARASHNPFRVEYTAVNLDTLEAFDGDAVDLGRLVAARASPSKGDLVKVLGGGELHPGRPGRGPRLLEVGRARRSPRPAGSVTVVPLPFGHGRPPAQGNALTNR